MAKSEERWRKELNKELLDLREPSIHNIIFKTAPDITVRIINKIDHIYGPALVNIDNQLEQIETNANTQPPVMVKAKEFRATVQLLRDELGFIRDGSLDYVQKDRSALKRAYDDLINYIMQMLGKAVGTLLTIPTPFVPAVLTDKTRDWIAVYESYLDNAELMEQHLEHFEEAIGRYNELHVEVNDFLMARQRPPEEVLEALKSIYTDNLQRLQEIEQALATINDPNDRALVHVWFKWRGFNAFFRGNMVTFLNSSDPTVRAVGTAINNLVISAADYPQIGDGNPRDDATALALFQGKIGSLIAHYIGIISLAKEARLKYVRS